MIGDLLTHRVTLVRNVALLAGGQPVLDEDGHLQHSEARTSGIAAAIQPLTSKERAAQHQAGLVVASTRIYTLPMTASPADLIEHDPDTCPADPDLPHVRYQLTGVQNAAGIGHHLEIDATEIGPTLKGTPPSSPGSGSGS